MLGIFVCRIGLSVCTLDILVCGICASVCMIDILVHMIGLSVFMLDISVLRIGVSVCMLDILVCRICVSVCMLDILVCIFYLFFRKTKKTSLLRGPPGSKMSYFFTITGDTFAIYVPIHRYVDFNTLQ